MSAENFYNQLEILPANLANHLKISVLSLIIGIAISLPLAIYVVKHPRFRYPTLTAVSIIQTIPSLALLALMVPLLAGLSALSASLVGVEISALGFYPTIIALTLYSMLPVVRNAVTGITGVDPSLTEAARGVGMTERQVLWKVELPLAAPVIIAGIRTATVWVVGIATLATPVGQRCLGNYIFRGLQTRNWTAVLFGCVAAALLAIVLDLLIGGLEKAVSTRRRKMTFLVAIALAGIVLGGMVAPSLSRAWVNRDEAGRSAATVWVGAKTFTEQYILAELVSDMLEDAGYQARQKESLGSTVIFDALAKGEIDVYVDYSGTIWANHMKRKTTPSSEAVLDQMSDWLRDEHGIMLLGALGFENAYGLAMRRSHARELGIETLTDLGAHAAQMKIGGDYEFFGRPEWRSIRDAYDLHFNDQVSFDSTFMYQALAQGEVDVISAFTSDGRIEAFDLVVLDDPQNAIPPYDAVILLSREAAERERLVEALEPLVGAVPVEVMRRASYMVDREKNKETVQAASEWLRSQVLP